MKKVYFARITNTAGPIKIGCSDAPRIRIRQLEVDMRADRANPPEMPKRSYPIGGASEWFHPTESLLAYIADVASTGRIDLADTECRERIIAKRIKAGETLQAIGRELGISRQRVHQILHRTAGAA